MGLASIWWNWSKLRILVSGCGGQTTIYLDDAEGELVSEEGETG